MRPAYVDYLMRMNTPGQSVRENVGKGGYMRPRAILKDDSELLVMTGQNPERQRAGEGGNQKS